MSDTKEGATVRIPAWLMDALEAEWQKRPRPRPTRGEILGEVWKSANWLERATQSGASYCEQSIPLEKIPIKLDTALSTDSIIVTSQEAQCISTLLDILRRGPQIARAALESNLGAFSYLTEIVQGAGVSDVGPADSVPDTPPDLQTTIDRLRDNQAAIDRELAKPFPLGTVDRAEGETATGTGGPAGDRRKPDKGRSGEGG